MTRTQKAELVVGGINCLVFGMNLCLLRWAGSVVGSWAGLPRMSLKQALCLNMLLGVTRRGVLTADQEKLRQAALELFGVPPCTPRIVPRPRPSGRSSGSPSGGFTPRA